MDAQGPLEQAIEAIRSGDRLAGKRTLVEMLQVDPRNVQAWLWMSEVADTDEQRRECLLRVLAIEPDNRAAQDGLARLAGQAIRTAHERGPHADALADPSEMGPGAIRAERDPGIPAPLARLRAQRRQAERKIMLAGGLSLTLVLGLVLLLVLLIEIIPWAGDRSRGPPQRALHTATLWCPACERQDRPVTLSTRMGAVFYRGAWADGLPHGTRVSVLRYRWSSLEQQYYALVTAEGKRGWVPETQIRR
jgi:hypothetical protein